LGWRASHLNSSGSSILEREEVGASLELPGAVELVEEEGKEEGAEAVLVGQTRKHSLKSRVVGEQPLVKHGRWLVLHFILL